MYSVKKISHSKNVTALGFLSTQLKNVLLVGMLVLSPCVASAQKTSEDDYAASNKKEEKREQKVPFKDRLVYGGNIGGYFGTRSFLQLNPMVGYKTTSWWLNGVGLNYIYASGGGIKQNVYGASVWSRAYIYKSLMLHTEFEMLSLNYTAQNGARFTAQVPVWFVGAGYQTRSNGIGLGFMILYDLIQDPNSPYSTPVFRVGGLIGF